MLEIKILHVSIGERKILDGLTLTIHDGEVAAIEVQNPISISLEGSKG